MGNFPFRNVITKGGMHCVTSVWVITVAFLLHIYDISSHQAESGTSFLNTPFFFLPLLSLALTLLHHPRQFSAY
ncbi:hypothetical protein BDV30DRAFT_217831 [Aspergillus minisclerotigenes]|uniref:Uncharacterized protein n=1 Tax=Aspergillus minisclerotigenes TaxID=656917 RepID=A0A5N6IRC0_9EURO|nr:hypothetical protein BDV30DRAFT_217831 [Aspergillus minisclerotigenes]